MIGELKCLFKKFCIPTSGTDRTVIVFMVFVLFKMFYISGEKVFSGSNVPNFWYKSEKSNCWVLQIVFHFDLVYLWLGLGQNVN